MNAITAIAIDNAKARARIGWPLVLLTVALYAPAEPTLKLVLLATGLLFLSLGTSADRPANKPIQPKPQSGPRTTKTAKHRGADGRWTA